MSVDLRQRMEDFKTWLTKHGAEVLPLKGEFEMLRFRYDKGLRIVYRNEKNLELWWDATTWELVKSFYGVKPARPVQPQPSKKAILSQANMLLASTERLKAVETGEAPDPRIIRRKVSPHNRDNLLLRDGPDCWCCGLPLGDDITVEHLLAIVKGGNNSLDNKCLCHGKCNERLGSLAIVDKVKIRELARREVDEQLERQSGQSQDYVREWKGRC